jgi:uncharacterized membrane protein YfcA
MAQYLQFLWLVPLGFFAGAYGTFIGAGGGFVLAPVLLLLYPAEAPEVITGISLTVVFFNAFSGTLAYGRANRIDYRSGMILAAANMPGAIIGALATTVTSRARFNLLFGVLLILAALLLIVVPTKKTALQIARTGLESPAPLKLNQSTWLWTLWLSTGFGFLSSFLGIGGGFLYVPALVYLLAFPIHAATATSLFVLTITSLTGLVTHIGAGLYHHGMRRALFLSIGAVLGAQIGARLSRRLRGDWILRGLALALGLAGMKLLMISLG